MKKTVEWMVKMHSTPLGDTGDYNVWYELTNGKTSLYGGEDDEDVLLEFADKLNELTRLKTENDELRNAIAKIKPDFPDKKIRELNPIWVRDEIVKRLTNK